MCQIIKTYFVHLLSHLVHVKARDVLFSAASCLRKM